MSSSNRFNVLSLEDVVGEGDQRETSSTPRQSRPNSRASSAASGSRNPSPTPSLKPVYVSPVWTWDGTDYPTLEEAVTASAATYNIAQGVIQWINVVMKSFVERDVTQVYNVLGDKIYEHRNAQWDINEQLMDTLERARNTINELKEENKQLKKDYTITLANNVDTIRELDVMRKNNATILQGVQVLSREIRELKAQQALSPQQFVQQFAPRGANVSLPTEDTTFKVQRPKAPDPPKYKGNKDVSLEEWLEKVGVWFRYNKITSDEERVISALMFLEGGVHSFMNDYSRRAAEGLPLGTWSDFVDRLKSGYRQVSPEKSAQKELDAWCNKRHGSVAKFAEEFRLHATKTGYSDVDLIKRIDDQRSLQVRNICITFEQITPQAIPKTWPTYLDWILDIEMKTREHGQQGSGNTSSGTRASSSKDPDAMDIDQIRKPEKLAKEQEEWLSKGLCFRCGKHKSLKKGEKCRTPKYKGFYELPARSSSTTQTRVVEEESSTEDKREQFIRAALEKYDEKQKKGKEKEEESTARIEEIDELDFLHDVL